MLSDVEAVQELVAQLHAIVYGYQLAIGQLPVVSSGTPARFASCGSTGSSATG